MGTKRKMVDSGVEWIGEVPSEWRVEKLSGLVQETSNKNRDMKENNLLSLSYGRIVRKDIESNQGLLPQSFEGYNIVSPGDVVLRLTDLQNDQRSLRTALVTERGIITSAYTTISAPAMEAKYFAYAMNACDSSKVFYRLGGGVRQSMRFQDIKQILIPIPDSFEQQSIATFLDHHVGLIDQERELIAQKIGLLKDKRKALIFECVTGKRTIVEAQHLAGVDDWSDIVGSGPLVAVPMPGKDDPFVKGGRLGDSGVDWIGEVPEGWRITRITDEYIVSAGIGAPQDAEPFQEGLLPFVRVSDLAKNPGRLVKETRDGVSVSYSQYKQKAGALVFPKSGESIRTGARKLLHMDSVVVGHLACVTSRTSGTNMDYGYYLFNAFDFEDELNQTALPALNLSAIQSKRIPFPSAQEQAGIATFLDHETNLIDREIELLETKSSLLADKRKALIFEAVTGKLDCTHP